MYNVCIFNKKKNKNILFCTIILFNNYQKTERNSGNLAISSNSSINLVIIEMIIITNGGLLGKGSGSETQPSSLLGP